uniref:Uncharacterized protein n=1 Tax=Arundo donax TaxID=35708 RepID=A0A0A9SV52_ARUDO
MLPKAHPVAVTNRQASSALFYYVDKPHILAQTLGPAGDHLGPIGAGAMSSGYPHVLHHGLG